VGEAQAFEFEGGNDDYAKRIYLGSHGSRGGLDQVAIGLQGWVKNLCWLPFWVGCGDFVIVTRQVTANQGQGPGATVLVGKDLPAPAGCFRLSLP